MSKNRLYLISASLCLGLAACSQSPAANDAAEVTEPLITKTASADIINNAGTSIGAMKIQQGPRGILIHIDVGDLPPGKHGMHFHAVGSCAPMDTFKDAGGHIMPENLPHGFFHPDGPHAGNLPNLIVSEDGTAMVELYSNLLMLDQGAGAILDADGSTLMIHTNPDDHFTQPIGGSGGRIACGVVEAGE